jgi:hypothetical protein
VSEMRQEDRHISDQELIQAADGELSSGRIVEVERHMAACWSCRVRRAELEQAIAGFVDARQGVFEGRIPPIEGPRALLQARMANLDQEPPASLWRRIGGVFEFHRLAFGAIALAGVLAGAFFYLAGGRPWTRQVYAMSTPNSGLTPGATLPVTREYVCAAGETDSLHVVPALLAKQVFAEYGLAPSPRKYEVDYLITPALGGAPVVRNLWPQPYAAGEWNAHVKDALEDRLHQMVCEGRLDLAAAQNDLATDWVAAYKKYFGTNRPLTQHESFTKDMPWE